MKITININEGGTMISGVAEPTDTPEIHRMGHFMLMVVEQTAKATLEMEGIRYNEHRATVDKKPPQQKG